MWSKTELLEVAQRQERLRKRVDVFNRSAVKYLQGIGQLQNIPEDITPLNDEDSDEEEDPFWLSLLRSIPFLGLRFFPEI